VSIVMLVVSCLETFGDVSTKLIYFELRYVLIFVRYWKKFRLLIHHGLISC
jgi:hypothetical protein